MLSSKFKPQHKGTTVINTMLLINEEAKQKWMNYLRIKANKSRYKKGRRLKELFIRGINYDNMLTEIIRELATIKKANEIASQQVLTWARRVEAQRA